MNEVEARLDRLNERRGIAPQPRGNCDIHFDSEGDRDNAMQLLTSFDSWRADKGDGCNCAYSAGYDVGYEVGYERGLEAQREPMR